MTKKIIMFASICLLTTSCLFGCGNDPKKSDDNATTAAKVEDTTKEDVAATESTTAEPTTEEKTTVHVKQGISVGVEKKNADKFKDLVIESGHVFNINDFCSNPEKDTFRGNAAFSIMSYLGLDTSEFEAKYFPAGAQAPEIPYEDNYSFTYTGDKKFAFAFMMERDNGFVYFDLYEVK